MVPRMNHWLVQWVLRSGKRIAVTVIGFGLVVAGLVLIVFPGPFTIPLILAGLAVLATEYAWARHALDETKRRTKDAVDRVRGRRNKNDATGA